jgi:hypothetical protein
LCFIVDRRKLGRYFPRRRLHHKKLVQFNGHRL